MELDREQLEELRHWLTNKPPLPVDYAYRLHAACTMALGALPLPEGEVKELVRRLQAAGVNDWAPTHEDVLKAAETLSRQAASLASARRLNHYARHHESCPARTEPTATCNCGFEAACERQERT